MLYEVARTRLLLADACEALGDDDDRRRWSGTRRATRLGASAPSPMRRPTAGTELPDGLTQRELGVLRLLAQGKTNRVIAEELFISEKTVASHVSHIFTKLGVASRAAATAYAYDHDLV